MTLKLRKVTRKWTQRDGTKIRICDMSDGHILNSIRMLERHHELETEACANFMDSLNGEMAIDACSHELFRMIEDGPSGYLYDGLVDEAVRRGILKCD